MLKKIGIGLAVIVVAFVAVVATRPATFRVERSTTIAAPADLVFAQINDFHNWGAWSPWDHLDPAQKKSYEGAATGAGAKYAWVGNDKVGEGRMTITQSKPNEQVAIELEFLKPWPSTSEVEFTLEPKPDGVHTTWAMTGHNNFMSKAFSMFMDMDKMLGGDFEKGLAGIKQVSEAQAKKRAEEAAKAEAAKKAAEEAAKAAEAAKPADGTQVATPGAP